MPVRAIDHNESPSAISPAEGAATVASKLDDLERRREIGQFFTPPGVAEFMWDMLEVLHGAKFSKRARVIDPSCGEGVFLCVAATRGTLPPGGLFGADIDESLLPLWRSDALLKEAHLFVANGLMDLPDHGLRAGSFDVVAGNPPFAGKGVRDLLRLLDDAATSGTADEKDLFGALVLQERPAPIGPPLTPAERTRLDHLAKALARFVCWRLTKESQENGDADASEQAGPNDLFSGLGAKPARANGGSEFDKAAELAASWPPNRPLDPRRSETRLLLRRLASTAIEVFFMERFLRLCKPGGLIAVIVPESIVASDQLAPLRTWLLDELDLLAVVSLPQKVFVGVGANAKTSIVFARRRLHPRTESALADENRADESVDDAPGAQSGDRVLMSSPNPDAPGYSLESYLVDVLEKAQAGTKIVQQEET